MKVGIVKEIRADERRVAASPATVTKLIKSGFEVLVETDAGALASFPDQLYRDAGATIVDDPRTVWSTADVVTKVRPPMEHPQYGHEADLLREGGTLISFFHPAQNGELLERLRARKATVLAMDCIPRISRAQKVDALSSMANIAGYRAVVEAANRYGSFFTGQMTAAGKVPPAKVLIIGAGVAGLAALGAARGLGAIVRAFDTRPPVREQVESLGGEFLEVTIEEDGEGKGGYAKEMSKEFIDAEMALFRAQAKEVNIVITTALIPGRPAPKLWLADMVAMMKPGSVVVDMAAEQGGNCELTRHGEVVVAHGVSIVGFSDLPSRMANVASDLYGTNIWHLLEEMGSAKAFKIDRGNDIVRGAMVTSEGEITWPPPTPKVEPPKSAPASAAKPAPAPAPAPSAAPAKSHGHGVAPSAPSRTGGIIMALIGLALAAAWLGLRYGQKDAAVAEATVEFLKHLTVFVLAVFVGWQVVWNVTPALHTPLMSVTNAISGIIVLGGLYIGFGHDKVDNATIIALVAILLASINIVGGFWVTRRMLLMFRK